MRKLLVVAVVGMAFLGAGCEEGDPKFKDKIEKQKAADQEAEAAAEAKKKADLAAAKKASDEANAKAEAEQKRLADLQPKGNAVPLEEVALDDDEKAIILELGKAGTFEAVAKKVKANPTKLEPLMIRALRYTGSNVRTQSAITFMINKTRSEDFKKALAGAIQDEADEAVYENWARDIRGSLKQPWAEGFYNDPIFLPVLRRALERASGAGGIGSVANTLCAMGDKEALPLIYAKLKGAEETMIKQELLNALKRLPVEANREVILPFITDKNQVVQMSAKNARDAIDMAKGAEKE